MPRGRWALVGGLGLAAVIAPLVMLRGRSPVVRGDDSSARLRELEARLALLESRRQSDHRSGAQGASSVGDHLPAPLPPGATGPEEMAGPVTRPIVPKAAEVNEKQLQEEYFGELDVRLSSEGRDPVWAPATEEKLRGSVADLRPRMNIETIQCGQTMCRMETSVP